jgi:hypothetical protein
MFEIRKQNHISTGRVSEMIWKYLNVFRSNGNFSLLLNISIDNTAERFQIPLIHLQWKVDLKRKFDIVIIREFDR